MRRVLIPAGLACVTVLLLGACGTDAPGDSAGTGAATTATGPDDNAAKQQKAENMIADCMKRKGFRYVPRTGNEMSPPRSEQFAGRRSLLQPDGVVRPLRQKYGFGVAARTVFPNDPMVAAPSANRNANPNTKIRESLDEAQRAAYDKAMGDDKAGGDGSPGCAEDAYVKVFGTVDLNRKQVADRKAWDRFSTDPAVVAAAGKYADCLRDKGYRLNSRAPGEVETFMLHQARPAAATAVGAEDAPGAAGDAKAQLTEEIKKAVDDLDCRGPYADLVRTRYPSVVDIDRNQG